MSRNYQIMYVGMFLFLSLIAAFPFFTNDSLHFGHDLGVHLLRIEGIKEALQDNKLLADISTVYLQGFGYPMDLFYPNLMLYIPAIARVLGFSMIHSYKIFMFITVFFTFISMFYSVLKISKHQSIAFFASVFYTMSAYRMIDIYIRAAVGEIVVLVFIPLVLLGVYYVLYEDNKKWYILTIGFTGVLLSHILTTLWTFGLLLLITLVSFQKLMKEKQRILSLIYAGIATFGLTAYFTLPMVEQYISSDLYIKHTSTFAADESALHWINLIKTSILNVHYPMNVGLVFLLLPFIRIFVKKKSSLIKTADWLTFMGIAFLLMSTNLFPWGITKGVLGNIQFPWRLLLYTTLFFSVSGSIYLYELLKGRKDILRIFYILIPLIMLLSNAPLFNYYLKDQKVLLKEDKEELNSLWIGAGKEYLPVNITLDDIRKRSKHKLTDNDNVEIEKYQKNGNEISFTYHTEQKQTIELPLIFYKGYHVYDTQNGEREELPIELGEKDFISVTLQGDGKLTTEYERTFIQKCSSYLSLLTLILALIFFFFRKRSFGYSLSASENK
ncbi:hypothetical protein ABES25_18965 [Bacillus gobiensis]|uniref:hypothetical protein n=1 Tax=Bacillus gobiensis TaxID=1441095 RepID=UPI003D1EC10D